MWPELSVIEDVEHGEARRNTHKSNDMSRSRTKAAQSKTSSEDDQDGDEQSDMWVPRVHYSPA